MSENQATKNKVGRPSTDRDLIRLWVKTDSINNFIAAAAKAGCIRPAEYFERLFAGPASDELVKMGKG